MTDDVEICHHKDWAFLKKECPVCDATKPLHAKQEELRGILGAIILSYDPSETLGDLRIRAKSLLAERDALQRRLTDATNPALQEQVDRLKAENEAYRQWYDAHALIIANYRVGERSE